MGTPLRVLVAARSADLPDRLLARLRDAGYELAPRRVAAVVDLESQSAVLDLALIEHAPPELDAPEAVRLLRARDADGPIVVVSDTFGEALAVEAMRAGADDYVLLSDIGNLGDVVGRALEAGRARREQGEAKAAYAGLVGQLPLGLLVIQDRRIAYANQVLADWVGQTPSELVALTPEGVGDLMHPDDREAAWERIAEGLRGERGAEWVPMRIMRVDGTHRWVESHSRPITFEGAPAVQGVLRDVDAQRRAEAALRENEERYREIIALANGVAYERDWVADRFAFIDEGIEHLTGIPANEITPAAFDGLLSGFAQRSDAAMPVYEITRSRRVGPDQRMWRAEYILQTRDGRRLHVADASVQVRGPDGCLQRSIGMLQDITPYVEAVREAELSDRVYREAIEASAGVPYRRNLIDDSYDILGEGIEELTGIPASEFSLTALQRLIQERAFVGSGADEDVIEHAVAFDGGKRPHYRADYRIRTPEGADRWLSDRAIPVRDPETGRVIASLGILQDITDRKLMEQRLRSSLRLNEATIATIPSFLVVVDADLKVITANHRCPEGLSVPLDVVGRPISEALPQGLATGPDLVELIRGVVEAGGQDELLGVRYWAPGRPDMFLDLRICGFSVGHAGSRRALLVIDDVSEQHNLEEQARQTSKLRSIGTLAGGVAHDFNNILTGITGYADLVLDGADPEAPETKDLVAIRRLADRAAGLTRQLLAFSRRQTLSPVTVDLNKLTADLAKMLGRILGEDLELALDLDPYLGAVQADPGQIEQALMNLAANARDAMPGGGQLTIETQNVVLDEAYASRHVGCTPGSYALVAVSDTGHGMDEATRERVFEPFFTTKDIGQGTGLGLATAYGIVKQHGGNIWVYSEPGQGTTVKLYLPLAAGANGAETADEAPPPLGGSETVLVVEDEESVLRIIRRILEDHGYEMFAATSAEEAEKLYAGRATEIPVLLADVVLPGRSGPQLYESLRLRNPALKVLYISGYTRRAAVRSSGLPDDAPLLQKPFAPHDLARRLRESLDG